MYTETALLIISPTIVDIMLNTFQNVSTDLILNKVIIDIYFFK